MTKKTLLLDLYFFIEFTLNMLDMKGNEFKEKAISFVLDKEGAKDINWSNFKYMAIDDYNNLIKISSYYYIYPLIIEKIKE